jgi:tRNA threonylcarbamoyladenosine biosynthesis protein TsaB
LGDGVPVYAAQIEALAKVPYRFASAANNRQRAASVASLGAVYYAQGKIVDAAAHEPEYLRKSQAERERDA